MEVHISHSPGSYALRVYFVARVGNEPYVIDANGNQHRVEPGSDTPPTFTIEPHDINVLVKALHDFGARLPDEGKVAGKLEATERHLEDLRFLAGLPPHQTTNEESKA